MREVVSRNSSVTAGMGLLCDRLGHLLQACGVSVGVYEVGGAAGLSCFATGVACEACLLAASLGTRATLELGHLCFLAVLRDLNLHPHVSHCRWRVGSLAAFAASHSLSRLEAQLLFRARRLFSFWALLALRPPVWRSKKARLPFPFRSSKIYTKHHLFHCENRV